MRFAGDAMGEMIPFTGALYWPGFKLGHAGGLNEVGMPTDKVVSVAAEGRSGNDIH